MTKKINMKEISNNPNITKYRVFFIDTDGEEREAVTGVWNYAREGFWIPVCGGPSHYFINMDKITRVVRIVKKKRSES